MAEDMLEILKSARRKVLASSFVHPLIGTDIGSDDMDSDLYSGAYSDGWVFYGVGDSLAPQRMPANTGTSAVTMGLRLPWTSPNDHNTMEFRQLTFIIYSDQTRFDADSNGLIDTRDAEYKCYRIAEALKNEFNDTANEVHWWDTTYIISCSLYSDLTIMDVEGQDGLVRGDIRFKLVLG